MEGIAGIVAQEQVRRGEIFYEEGRRLLTSEVNTLVTALVAHGIADIIVKDAHGTGLNLLVEHLHPGARYVLGPSRTEQRFPGLDSSFSAAFLIGYHAMAGTEAAIMDHTMVPFDWQCVELDGQAVGEITLDALIFGVFGVPVTLVSGDDKTCAEARNVLGEVATYETKQAIARNAALALAPAQVQQLIESAVGAALTKIGSANPCRLSPRSGANPHELRLTFASSRMADGRYYDGESSIRVDGTTALYRDADLLRLLARAL